jgi:ATP-dependent Clp protease ATP-binding subunit ClpB
MEMDRLTENAMAAVASAQEAGLRLGHQQIDGEHLHYALATQQDGLIPKLLGYMGIDTASMCAAWRRS